MSRLKLSDLVVVTSSPDKLAEINEILGTNHKVSKVDIPEIQSLDLDEVIENKAKSAYEKIKKPVLIEDVSFEIERLKGLPGTFIKFFLKTLGTEGTVALVEGKDTTTKVTAAVAIFDGKNLKVFKGTIYGTLSPKDRGEHGFGFDKVFIPNGYNQTLAEMPPSLKIKISHRAKVLEKVKGYFSEKSSASLVLNH